MLLLKSMFGCALQRQPACWVRGRAEKTALADEQAAYADCADVHADAPVGIGLFEKLDWTVIVIGAPVVPVEVEVAVTISASELMSSIKSLSFSPISSISTWSSPGDTSGSRP